MKSLNRKHHRTQLTLGVTITLTAFLLAGCASQPEELKSQYVSPLQYKEYNCDQIAGEMQRTSRRINDMFLSLKKTADDDSAQVGIGLILFWPTLFFLEGGDGQEAVEYGRLKGEYEALEMVSIEKKCSIPLSAKIAKWAHLAKKSAKQSCTIPPGNPKFISATGTQEVYQVPCDPKGLLVVQCDSGECKVLK